MDAILQKISSIFIQNHWQLVTAESCTGGMIASLITEIPGSSQWFERGFVTYSNASKQELLGVRTEDLIKFGAVSEEVAIAMATGALQHSAGQVAVSVTGIAGPDGGTSEKPVGTVCFGWAIQGRQPISAKKHFIGTRQEVRQAACEFSLSELLSLLLIK